MLIVQFMLFMIYIMSAYLFEKFRMALATLTFVCGFVFLLNEWDSTVVEDSTIKLVFILSFLLYSLMVIYNVFTEADKK